MNGRIYDPLLGRFLSADTFVQDAGDLQAYNRYSYVRNNPSSLNDPSGHFWSAVITAGFAAYDTYQYATGKISGGEYAKNMALNGAALVADVATLGNGGGLAVRAANIAIRTAKVIDKANDVYETAQGVVAAVEATSELASKVVEGNATLADVGNAALAVGGSALDAAGGGKGPDLPTEKMHVSRLDGGDITPNAGHGRVDASAAPATQANTQASLTAQPSQLEKNAQAGADWDKKVTTDAPPGHDKITQATMQVETSNGTVTIRADEVVMNKQTGEFTLVEAKASATAPLTKNQGEAFPVLGAGGTATVRGTKWAAFGLEAGAQIKFKDVLVVRPNNVELVR